MKFIGALRGAIDVDRRAGIGIGEWVIADAVAFGLCQDVSIRPASLQLVADAAVEVVLVSTVHPEGKKALGKLVVDEFGDGAVETPHHGGEVATDLEITQDVIVIGQERRDERDESIFIRVMVKAFPKDVFAGSG